MFVASGKSCSYPYGGIACLNLSNSTVDKFTFRVALDRVYTPEGIWAMFEGRLVRIGLSDFPQQRSGDVAFAQIMPVGVGLKPVMRSL